MSIETQRKRKYEETKEFMPLSSGKLFGSDDENNFEYDWGFKKSTKSINNTNETKNMKLNNNEELQTAITKRFVYKTADPLKLKDDDKEIYLENLTKIYDRSYVYVPSFYDVSDVFSNTDKIINSATNEMFEKEIKSLSDDLETIWIPLTTQYVETNRLSPNCVAYKMIVKNTDLWKKTKMIYEGCLDNFKEHAAQFKDILKIWTMTDQITTMFRESVVDVLLKYVEQPHVLIGDMVEESNNPFFTRMVRDDVQTVKTRVEKNRKIKKIKKSQPEEVEPEHEMEPETNIVERPASKSVLENKGLVPRRKKVDGNPRVKHRMKFKKAIVRYHSQVPRSRDDAANYQGEQSGIRIGVIKSKKFK